ncbi:MAG TPA: sigma-70 family RNA polymerase sigma factor [Terriglobia bacterium]|nr:sigma-70 family RNA polymerase sigma factor [Terriglobia bacterium]
MNTMKIDAGEIRVLIRMVTQRTGPPVYDDDLTQDVTLKVMEACRRQCEIRHPRAFLMKVVRDAVHDYWRKRRVVFDISTVDESRFAELPNFERDLDRRRQAELLHQALLQLESSKRATVELFYSSDYSIAEISRIQGKSESAIKTELMRSRRALAGKLRELANKKSPV